jgi:hypothetical protein
MKTLPDSPYLHERIDPVRVYLDDLEELVALLSSMALNVTLVVGRVQYDSLDELCDREGATIDQLVLKGTHPEKDWIDVTLEFRFGGVELSTGDANLLGPRSFAIRERVRALKYSSIVLKTWFWIVLMYAVIPLIWLTPKRYGWLPLSVSLVVVCFATASLLARRNLKRLHLRHRHEGGFWKRNTDQILLAVLSALAGAIVTALGAWVLRK